jgi:membrane associated rhomboid family serine protease/TolA-binding protein
MQALHEYFERHEEQAFIAKAFLTIILILIVKKYLSGFLFLLFIFFPVIFLVYIRLRAATEGVSTYSLLKQNITFIPIMYAEGDRKKEVIPYITYGIILINVLIYYLYENAPWGDPKFIANNLVFLPHTPEYWNIVVSAFTAMFLHASFGHLWGNMIFLWMLGTAVERRIGPQRFALLYIITGLFGGVAFVLAWYLADGDIGHSLGASGAIAGIMGIFAVRCYFKSMIFPIPILGIFSLILPISLKVRLNSLVIIGLFFLSDLSGGIDQMSNTGASMIGHWCHLGGMISGMILSGFLKLGEGAIEERHLEIGLKAAGSDIGYGDGEQSLRKVLRTNANSAEAVLALARIKSKYHASDEGQELYSRAIGLLLATYPKEAAQTYLEYRKTYHKQLEAQLLFALAGIFQRQMDLDSATRCLEAVIATPDVTPELRQRALAQCANMLDKMGHEEAAEGYFEILIEEYPHSELAHRAYTRLGRQAPPAEASTQAEAISAPIATSPVIAEVQPASHIHGKNCPVCNSSMQKRRACKGTHEGKMFWVCTGYPACNSVVPI